MHDLYATISQAASRGPVIALVAGSSCCYAVVVCTPASAAVVKALPNVNAQGLEQLRDVLSISAKSSRASASRGMRVTPVLSSKSKAAAVLQEL